MRTYLMPVTHISCEGDSEKDIDRREARDPDAGQGLPLWSLPVESGSCQVDSAGLGPAASPICVSTVCFLGRGFWVVSSSFTLAGALSFLMMLLAWMQEGEQSQFWKPQRLEACCGVLGLLQTEDLDHYLEQIGAVAMFKGECRTQPVLIHWSLGGSLSQPMPISWELRYQSRFSWRSLEEEDNSCLHLLRRERP